MENHKFSGRGGGGVCACVHACACVCVCVCGFEKDGWSEGWDPGTALPRDYMEPSLQARRVCTRILAWPGSQDASWAKRQRSTRGMLQKSCQGSTAMEGSNPFLSPWKPAGGSVTKRQASRQKGVAGARLPQPRQPWTLLPVACLLTKSALLGLGLTASPAAWMRVVKGHQDRPQPRDGPRSSHN